MKNNNLRISISHLRRHQIPSRSLQQGEARQHWSPSVTGMGKDNRSSLSFFFKKNEFERIADDLSGSILLDVDLRNSNHHDFSFLRIKIGIADIEVIPPFRKLKFTERDGLVSFHTLYYEFDREANMLMEDSLDQDPRHTKVKAYWQKKVNGENSKRKKS
jgi:hypothetical protein